MTRLKGLGGGRLRIWWVTHRRDAIRAAQLLTIAALYLVASTLDHQDALEQANAAREEAIAMLAEDRALRGLPNPAIVLDAENARRYGLRLSEIAGGLDVERAQLRGKPR